MQCVKNSLRGFVRNAGDCFEMRVCHMFADIKAFLSAVFRTEVRDHKTIAVAMKTWRALG